MKTRVGKRERLRIARTMWKDGDYANSLEVLKIVYPNIPPEKVFSLMVVTLNESAKILSKR